MSVFYPSTGNSIAFVGNVESRHLVRQAVESFRKPAAFPAEGAALPGAIPGVGWSDHWSFWQAGYPGVMVTDTAPFRYPHYHEPEDTPDKVDYERLAKVTVGLEKVVADLAGVPQGRARSKNACSRPATGDSDGGNGTEVPSLRPKGNVEPSQEPVPTGGPRAIAKPQPIRPHFLFLALTLFHRHQATPVAREPSGSSGVARARQPATVPGDSSLHRRSPRPLHFAPVCVAQLSPGTVRHDCRMAGLNEFGGLRVVRRRRAAEPYSSASEPQNWLISSMTPLI